MEALRKLLNQLYARLLAWLQGSNPATLQLTGILGLAVVVIGYYHFKGNDEPSAQRQRQQEQARRQAQADAAARQQRQQRHGEAGPSNSNQHASASKASGAGHSAEPAVARTTPVAQAVSSRLQGVRRITVSCPGVLLQQWQPGQLMEQATLWPGVAEIVQEMAYVADVYLIGQVTDDIGQALVSGALESAGITGNQSGQIPPHRLLFCSTLEGKVAIVRQLEAELHIDSAHLTIDSLQRFVPQLLFVRQPSAPDAAQGTNVARATSLKEFFQL